MKVTKQTAQPSASGNEFDHDHACPVGVDCRLCQTGGTTQFPGHRWVVPFAIIAFSEFACVERFIISPMGAWLIAAPGRLDGMASLLATWNGVISGTLLMALALPRRRIKEFYAGWDRHLV